MRARNAKDCALSFGDVLKLALQENEKRPHAESAAGLLKSFVYEQIRDFGLNANHVFAMHNCARSVRFTIESRIFPDAQCRDHQAQLQVASVSVCESSNRRRVLRRRRVRTSALASPSAARWNPDRLALVETPTPHRHHIRRHRS